MEIRDNSSEKINRSGYGSSISVDNVQALASEELKDIPIRYVRPEIESEAVLMDESLQVPVIDFNKLSVPGKPGYEDELAKLHVACRDWGFFQLINHGVSEVMNEMKKVTEEFFKLPLEEKMKYAQISGIIEGYGQAFVVSEDKNSIGVTCSISKTFDHYSNELNGVSKELFKFMSTNLGMEPNAISRLYENCIQSIRMNYYPPCRVADKVLGLAPHSDQTGLTLLVQVNEVQGLQIKKNSKWVPIKPIPGSIIVNIGDIMEIMSNGEYRSIEHRVTINLEKERISIAAFHTPGLEVKIGPLPEIIKEKTTKYKTIDVEDYLRLSISNKLDGKSLIEQMKIQE
ncbi:hypothetical protein L6452_13259 [Arctium lappa]|uniref:Uncharacterized protein n=1 Tax=Arctium lappa TaxID=4217 RepID=A0ACB9CI26_ARCLA|nr:hypothetical protein L6452_13259 [Arctium lappa]